MVELLELHRSMVGGTRRELDERLAQLARDSGHAGLRLAASVLEAYFPSEVVAAIGPREARAAAFSLAADRPGRDVALARAAVALGVTTRALDEALLADVPDHRRIKAPDEPMTADTLALRCNLKVAGALLSSCSGLRIELEGQARAVVRHAQLRGLICTARRNEAVTVLEVSGPLSLFRRTTVYGRHLASVLPLLAWCRTFRLQAQCVIGAREGRLLLDGSAPLVPSAPPRRYDSRLEERFARDFVKATSRWYIVREPEPVPADGALIFPDFALVNRQDPNDRWLLEIMGFWTADYVEKKLRRLRSAGLQRLILCIDVQRNCGSDELPTEAHVLRFKRRVDVRDVLTIIE